MNWITTTRRKWTDLAFSLKLFTSFLVLCLLPMLIVTQIYYYLSKSDIHDNSADFIRLFTYQLQTTLNNYMTQIENTSRSIFSDPKTIDFLGNESAFTIIEKISHKLVINRMLSQYSDQLPFVEGIMLISKKGNIYSLGGYPSYYNESGLTSQPWYQQILGGNGQLVITPAYLQNSNSGLVSNVFTAGRLIKDQEAQGVGTLLFHLTATGLITRNENLNTLITQYHARIVITNKQGKFIYDSGQPSSSVHPADIADKSAGGDSFITITGMPAAVDLNVLVMVPKDMLYNELDRMKITTSLILGFSIFILAICSFVLSYHFTKPIHLLTRNIRHVEDGYYRPMPDTGRRDEIGVLILKYNLMISKIKHLIEDVYQAEIRQNSSRLLALQTQINPHWLNNTLESIRMKAHTSGAKEVAVMIKTLGKLFHLALTHNPRDNRISDELHYIELYTHLQNIRYNGLFSLTVELEDRLRHVPLISLVFQPIIENSIVHGFWDDTQPNTIVIRATERSDATVITIIDNGAGMNVERLQAVRRSLESVPSTDTAEGSSIGLRNVHERLRLHYGVNYGLTIDSTEGQGTIVSISIPPLPNI
ncbi:cache domain-containing sensor histidine kinase [Paenibacillus koleovorans]|uniref:cache domain-containing sensor histidine kinase n=1 Tax=Paenibacillus koleovorans TaxID=121608 RepID=UPI000FD8C8F0|nr:sensor histidine kinase [Paenibacillus koleovorans]